MSSPALPSDGEVFVDVRGEERALRVSWHRHIGHNGIVVLSLWKAALCVGTFRMAGDDVRTLVNVLISAGQLADHMDEPYDVEREGLADEPEEPGSDGARPAAQHSAGPIAASSTSARTTQGTRAEQGGQGGQGRQQPGLGSSAIPESTGAVSSDGHPGYPWPPPPEAMVAGAGSSAQPAVPPWLHYARRTPWPPEEFDDLPEETDAAGDWAAEEISVTGDVTTSATDDQSSDSLATSPTESPTGSPVAPSSEPPDEVSETGAEPTGSAETTLSDITMLDEIEDVVYVVEAGEVDETSVSDDAAAHDEAEVPPEPESSDGTQAAEPVPSTVGEADANDETIDVGLDIFWAKSGADPRSA